MTKKALKISLVLGFIGALFMLGVGIEHNSQGEFCGAEGCDFPYILALFLLWWCVLSVFFGSLLFLMIWLIRVIKNIGNEKKL